EELITFLEERLDSVWQELFTEAETRGSSVSLRRLLDSIVDGPFGSSLTSAHYTPYGTRVIRLGNIAINRFKDEDQAFISDEYASTLQAHSAQAGDVIVAGLGDE